MDQNKLQTLNCSYTPNTDGCISQGSLETQLGVVVWLLTINFITNFPQNAPVKKI